MYKPGTLVEWHGTRDTDGGTFVSGLAIYVTPSVVSKTISIICLITAPPVMHVISVNNSELKISDDQNFAELDRRKTIVKDILEMMNGTWEPEEGA